MKLTDYGEWLQIKVDRQSYWSRADFFSNPGISGRIYVRRAYRNGSILKYWDQWGQSISYERRFDAFEISMRKDKITKSFYFAYSFKNGVQLSKQNKEPHDMLWPENTIKYFVMSPSEPGRKQISKSEFRQIFTGIINEAD